MTQQARADLALVRRGQARSREHAASLLRRGRVSAAGTRVTKPAQRIDADTDLTVTPDPQDPEYASRAGHKLAGALAAFEEHGLCVRGRRCLDVGASAGGFTDVLLRGGAAGVLCLDVGHDQLVPRLREDPRTVVVEGRNVRDLTVADVAAPVDLVVVDVSFISLQLVLPAVVGVMGPSGDLVVLVKPQFEVGRRRLGRGGVVRDPELRRAAVDQVTLAAAGLGLHVRQVAESPLPGPAGNVEFFCWLRGDGEKVAR